MKTRRRTGATGLALSAAAMVAIGMIASPLLAQQPAAPAPAQAPTADDKVDTARIDHGRDIFTSWGCTSCHSLADAGSHGDVGPHLDGSNLTEAFITSRVTNGQGAMPAFGGQLTDKEIADLAYYIAHVQKKAP